MAMVSIAGRAVISGTISLPRVGAWVADLLVDTEELIQGAVAIQIGAALELRGTVTEALAYQGVQQVRVVAGGGGLRKTARPKYYDRPTLGNVLRDLATDAGEAVSADADAAALGTQFTAWTTVAMSTGRLVAEAVRGVAGAVWRMLPDGTLWVGPEAWPESAVTEWRELGRDGINGLLELGLDVPTLAPGTTLGDERIDRVEHTITSSAVRTRAWLFREGEGATVDHDLLALARGSASPVDFHALYAGKTTRQTGQRFDVALDDTRIPPMTTIPLRNGVPGLTVAVGNGARILVGWRNGDPREPFCALWGGGESVGALTFTADEVNVGGSGAEAALLAETFRAAQEALHTAGGTSPVPGLVATFSAMAGACTGPLAPLQAGFSALSAAISAFEAKKPTFLASRAKVK